MAIATMYAAPAARRNQNLTRQSAAQLKLGPVSATFVTIAMISLLALLYLNQVTKTSYFTYQTAQLSAAKNKLMAQKQTLSVEAARLQSISTIQNSSVAKGMVAEGKPTYAN
jgi:cell division protein FtsL